MKTEDLKTKTEDLKTKTEDLKTKTEDLKSKSEDKIREKVVFFIFFVDENAKPSQIQLSKNKCKLPSENLKTI